MQIPYDIEIVGGLPVTGYVYADDGRIEAFDLPDGTRLEPSVFGGVHATGQLKAIGDLVLAAIQSCYGIMESVERTRPYVRPDSAPIRINAMVG